MSKRERFALTTILIGCVISIILFAFVSLAHFLQNPPKITTPLIEKVVASAVNELSVAELDSSAIQSAKAPDAAAADNSSLNSQIVISEAAHTQTAAAATVKVPVTKTCAEIIDLDLKDAHSSENEGPGEKTVSRCLSSVTNESSALLKDVLSVLPLH